jgi:hypothetical protein
VGWLILVPAIGYAVVSVFGAWSVVRRRRALAFTFMASAALLTVGGVAAAYRLPESAWLIGAGAATASGASLWNALRVLPRVVARNHVARAVAGLVLTLAAALAFR